MHARVHRPAPQADFDELGQRTDGFSGSDIAVVVKDVLMQPVRKTQVRRALGGWLLLPRCAAVRHRVGISRRVVGACCPSVSTNLACLHAYG